MSKADVWGIAKQSSFGTMNATPAYYVPLTTGDMQPDENEIELDEIVGDYWPTDSDPGGVVYRLPMEGACRVPSLPRILSMWFGAPTTTTPAGGTASRQHVFDPVGEDPVWHSLLLGRADTSPEIVDLVYDVLGNDFSFSASAPDGYLMFSGDAVGLNLDDAQSFPGAPSFDEDEKFAFHKVTAFLSVGGGSEAAFSCRNFTISGSRAADTDFYQLGNRSPYSARWGSATLEAEFVIQEALNTHYREGLAATRTPRKLRILAEGSTIEGSIKKTVEFTLHRGMTTSAPAPLSTEVLKGITVSLRGSKDPATGLAISARVINSVASY